MSARFILVTALGLALARPAFPAPTSAAPASPSAAPASPPAAPTSPPAAQTAPPTAKTGNEDKCYACHKDIDSPQAKTWEHDVHFAAGIGCAGCHGGDPTQDDEETAMSKARGYKGKLRKSDIPAVCGECHGAKSSSWRRRYRLTDVTDSLMTGVHGQALRESEAGPQCVSCHGVHEILKVSDPRAPVHPLHVAQTCAKCHSDAKYMRNFDPRLPVDQYEKYLTSEHGKRNAAGDPHPATCVSCHSNHFVLKVKDPRSPVYATHVPGTCSGCHSNATYMADYNIPTDQYAKYKRSRHGIMLLQHSDLNAPACNSCHGNHGAVPPGSASVVAICGNCHQANAELFEKSPHKEIFVKKNLPGCVVCHGNHLIESPTDALVGFSASGPCAKCHRNDATDRSAPVINKLRAVLDSLHAGNSEADTLLDHAEQLGMDVSDARYDLKGAHQALVQSRVAIHSFRVAELTEVARPGIDVVSGARKAAREAIHEYYYRRKGLAISTLIVTVMAFLLYLKIREIEREAKTE